MARVLQVRWMALQVARLAELLAELRKAALQDLVAEVVVALAEVAEVEELQVALAEAADPSQVAAGQDSALPLLDWPTLVSTSNYYPTRY